jgi:hypothetical protein
MIVTCHHALENRIGPLEKAKNSVEKRPSIDPQPSVLHSILMIILIGIAPKVSNGGPFLTVRAWHSQRCSIQKRPLSAHRMAAVVSWRPESLSDIVHSGHGRGEFVATK